MLPSDLKTDDDRRATVVREALSWVGTPYVNGGDVKGAGVDCGMLLVRAFVDAGIVEPFDPRPYPEQWHLHQVGERYLGWVEKWATEVDGPPDREPRPADVVMFRFGKCYAHGAIVVRWPVIVHIHRPMRCSRSDVLRDSVGRHSLAALPKRYFSLW